MERTVHTSLQAEHDSTRRYSVCKQTHVEWRTGVKEEKERERADCILTIVTPPTTEFRKVGCVDERAREREAKEREREKERAFVEEAEREKERPASPLLDSSLFNDPHT